MDNLELKIFNYLSKRISPKRFEHSYSVAMLAAELAEIHNVDVYQAQTAGLLHDLAKYKTAQEQALFFRNRKKPKYFEDIKRNAPKLLHGFIAAIVAKEEFGIRNKDVLNAISSHTLARAGMSALEKIIFIADYTAEGRKRKELKALRNLAKKDLDAAFKAVMTSKLSYVIERNMWLCVQTVDAWNYYVKEI